MAGISSETSGDNLPITRVAIPDDHTFVHIGGCRYIKFQFGGANYLECSQCAVRTYYQHHTTKFYHLRNCIHWSDITQHNSLNIIDAHRFIYIPSSYHNTASSEIPPPYTEYDTTLPAYEP
jgi:hypothetical protein